MGDMVMAWKIILGVVIVVVLYVAFVIFPQLMVMM